MKKNLIHRLGHRSHRAQLSTSAGVLLLVLAVFGGGIDRLPARGAHFVVDAAGEFSYTPSAVHPAQALHVERATSAKRQWSPLGLHNARIKKSAQLGIAVAVAPPQLRSFLPEAPDLAVDGAAYRPSGARAPPFA
jgi:hypothetical protein